MRVLNLNLQGHTYTRKEAPAVQKQTASLKATAHPRKQILNRIVSGSDEYQKIELIENINLDSLEKPL